MLLENDEDESQGNQTQGDKTSNVDDTSSAHSISPETDLLARAQGWRPKEEFQGDVSKWVDADVFVERGRSFNSNLKKELAAVQRELATFKGTAEQFAKFHKETVAAKDKEIDSAIRQLRLQKSEATSDGDHEAVLTIEDRIDTLREQKQELKKEVETPADVTTPMQKELEKAKVDPVVAAWVEDGNAWFNDDVKLRNYCMGIAEELRQQGDKTQGRPFLDKVKNLLVADFPAKFSNTNRQRAGTTEVGTRTVTVGGKSERDLPEEDRTLMNRFVKDGLMTKEAFLKDYFTRG